MSGRKCECCSVVKSGHCPFDYSCKRSVWAIFLLSKRIWSKERVKYSLYPPPQRVAARREHKC